MYQLGNVPSREDNLSEIADFIELKCLFSTGGISLESIRKAMAVESDELNFDGINDDDDKLYNRLDEVYAELERRKIECNNHYPFTIRETLVEVDSNCPELIKDYYLYLLLATRANMRDDRFFTRIDATLLFEQVSELVVKSYFGDKAKTMIMGTSTGNAFRDKVTSLLRNLKMSGTFRSPVGSTGRQKDGKLDIVVWLPFTDERDSMFIGFGQCKTGTSWDDKLTELQPSSFFANYTNYTPIHIPSRLFFIADSISIAQEKWEERARNAGILFDRRRIMEYLPYTQMPDDLTTSIRVWNASIIQKYSIRQD